MTRTRYIGSAMAALLLAFCSGASAQCIRVVQAERELPFEVDTPQGNHLSYFYNLATEQYFVIATKGAAPGIPRGPYVLTRACAPAKLEWENAEFVVLTGGCGNFCWYADVLPVLADRGEPQHFVMRPLAFDEGRSLLAFYEQLGIITVRNLVTQSEQQIRTPGPCQGTMDTCLTGLHFTGDAVEYTWKPWRSLGNDEVEYLPDELITAPLDAALTARTP